MYICDRLFTAVASRMRRSACPRTDSAMASSCAPRPVVGGTTEEGSKEGRKGGMHIYIYVVLWDGGKQFFCAIRRVAMKVIMQWWLNIAL